MRIVSDRLSARAVAGVGDAHGDRRLGPADAAVEMRLDRVAQAEQFEHARPHVVDDVAQLREAADDLAFELGKLRRPRHALAAQRRDLPRDAGKVGERLVVQVHGHAAPFALHAFGQLARRPPASSSSRLRASLSASMARRASSVWISAKM